MQITRDELEKICGNEKCQSYLNVVDELNNVKKLTKKLDTVLDSSYDGIFITDGNAVTTRVNKAYERITGVRSEMILGKNVNYLVEQGVISRSCSTLVLENKKVTTIQQKLASGKVLLVTGTPIFADDGEIEMVVTNVRDITDLLKLKEELQEKERKMDFYNLELEKLRKKLYQKHDVVTRNPVMKNLLDSAKRVANRDTTVLITGETGVGKEVIAEYIHKNSPRAKEKLIRVNCGAIPETLIESELFGYEKGAFTGANASGKTGLFEEANKGTIFLDEIGELPFNVQAKLLRVLQEHEIQRVGGVESVKIDVRIITATNKDLKAMSDLGEFRKDLYYRLNIIPVSIPPLRERQDDIIPLTNVFLDKLNLKYGENKRLSKEVYEVLYRYDWPGNIRELKNVIERIFVMSVDEMIGVQTLPFELTDQKKTCCEDVLRPMKEAVAELEYKMICKAFDEHGNVRDAAKVLDIDASTFVRKRRKYEDMFDK